MKAPTKLTVVIRDTSPCRYMQEPPKLRVVEIKLTEDQRRELILEWTDQNFTEEVSQAILG